jgi:hypothetical protein
VRVTVSTGVSSRTSSPSASAAGNPDIPPLIPANTGTDEFGSAAAASSSDPFSASMNSCGAAAFTEIERA